MAGRISLDADSWDVERRPDGSVIVRVHSRPLEGQPLPDAVFTFREGDPQYEFWQDRYAERQMDDN